jgi:HEAT repeat protein
MPTPGRPTLKTVKELEEQRDYKALLFLITPDNSPVIRRAAAAALGAVAPARNAPEIATRLAEILPDEPDRGVRKNIVATLGRLGDDAGIVALLNALKDRELMIREEAARALSRFNSDAAFDALLNALQIRADERDWQMRSFAADALGQLGDRRAVPALLDALKDEHALVRPAAALALGRIGDEMAVGALKRARHTTPHQRGAECAECAAIDAALKLLENKN